MTRFPPIVYFDRGRGEFATEHVYARGFLNWLYNSRSGGSIGRLLTGSRCASRLYGWLQRQRWTRRRIGSFVREMGIDMSESRRGITEFSSFSDFFTREIDLSRRPLCPASGVCVAPADGKALAYATLDAGATFRIKRAAFSLGGLLGDSRAATEFEGGAMVVIRLALSDYHHFHFPDSGVPAAPLPRGGRYEAGGPYAQRTIVPFFGENYRMVTRFESDHFGPMAMVEVGALTVGSIRQRFLPGVPVAKGERKGYFELGGSTVVLLFRRGAIHLDNDIVNLTASEIETSVRMGDSLGRSES
jgi:phosphatidylserine decarboxylase